MYLAKGQIWVHKDKYLSSSIDTKEGYPGTQSGIDTARVLDNVWLYIVSQYFYTGKIGGGQCHFERRSSRALLQALRLRDLLQA